MARDVFISYSNKDQDAADQIRAMIEERGISCWIAPRDVRQGKNYAVEILDGIDETAAMVLIMSESANASLQVRNEVKRAYDAGKPILLARIREVTPSPPLEFFVNSFRWLDVWKAPIDAKIDQLCDVIRALKDGPVAQGGEIEEKPIVGRGRAAQDDKRGQVFISANHRDYRFASEVYDYLRSHGIPVFFSDQSLPELGSSDYRKEIDKALDAAKHMIVVTSSSANVNSSWVEAEWGLFINEKRSGRKPGNIVTVAVDPLGPSELPASLRYYEVIPFDPEQLSRLLRYVAR